MLLVLQATLEEEKSTVEVDIKVRGGHAAYIVAHLFISTIIAMCILSA